MRRITLITTGGTIEKTYDEATGELSNRQSRVRRMLKELRLEDTTVEILELMSKDSLEFTDVDRELIAEAVSNTLGGRENAPAPVGDHAESTHTEGPAVHGVVILHGTDTLENTGEVLVQRFSRTKIPIVLTGAMRPFEMKKSDALQNLTEAIFSTGCLPPGIYCVAHGRALQFPGVHKDRSHGTFHGGVEASQLTG